MTLTIPYPPSVNTYWNFRGHQRFLTKKANDFKNLVKLEFLLSKQKSFGSARLQVEIILYPPDKRIRDIDNSIKSCLDALCQAGAFDDDSQIDVLIVNRGEIIKGGMAKVSIASL